MKHSKKSILLLLTLTVYSVNYCEAYTVSTEAIIQYVPYKEIGLAILGVTSSFLIWRVQHQKQRIQEIERQLSAKKFEMYSEFIYLIFDIINEEKHGKKVDAFSRMMSIKRNMYLYASDEIFLAFTEWLTSLNDPSQFGNGVTTHFKKFYVILDLIRKEMVNKKTKIDLDQFMLFVMQNKEEYQKFKLTNNW